MGRGGGLRIDHVMGLFRLFWIPPGGGPDRRRLRALPGRRAAGRPGHGERAGRGGGGGRGPGHGRGGRAALGGRRACCRTGSSGSRTARPSDYPAQALAAVTTHDLPTIAGVWSGDDAADQRAAGIEPDEAALERLKGKLDGA